MSESLPLDATTWKSLPPQVQEVIRSLQQQVHHLQAQLDQLQQLLNQNSSNSSRPPSTDPPQHKRKPPQPSSGKPRGGQPGHKPQQRPLVGPDQVQQTFTHKPHQCRRCGHPLHGTDPQPLQHQVAELPVIQPTIVEHQLHRLRCPCCQTSTCATLPEGVPTGAFGPRLQAFLGLLAGAYRLGKRPIQQLAGDLLGLDISLGQITTLERRTAQALQVPVQQLHDHVRTQPTNVDETSWRQQGQRHWLWVAVTHLALVFLIRPSRGAKVLRELMGKQPRVVITSDRFKSYEMLDPQRRQLCWAHLRRDFQALIDRGGKGKRVGWELLLLSDEFFVAWYEVRDGTWDRADFRGYLKWIDFERRWREEVAKGQVCGCARAERLCRELHRLDQALWQFSQVEGVEPTNNAAEQALRHGVLWRKSSYGTASEAGSTFVERILSVVGTCRLQGRNVWEYVSQCCEASLQQSPPPSLLPAFNS
jgi:transposase